jgi:lysozyme family protein
MSEPKRSKIDVVEKVLQHEGGYQNSKADAANKNSKGEWVGTKYGITPAVYEEYFGKTPTQQDMRKLKREDAKKIYEERYVEPIKRNLGVDESNPAFPQMVDMAVNHGYSGMVAMLQRATGATVDGKAGPGTRQALQSVDPMALNEALVSTRIQEYDRITKARPETSAFLEGWINRAQSFLDG